MINSISFDIKAPHQPDSQHHPASSDLKRENSLISQLIEILAALLPGIEAP